MLQPSTCVALPSVQPEKAKTQLVVIIVFRSNFLVPTNIGEQWIQSSKRIRDYKDEIKTMEQLECPNGCRQALELHGKATNFGLASYKKTEFPTYQIAGSAMACSLPKKSIFVPLGGLTSVCLNTRRRDEKIIPLGAMPSEAMAAGPKCRNQPTCESGAGPVKMVRSEYK